SASVDIIVDTVGPPLKYGFPNDATNNGLAASSDTGVGSDPPTLVDRITSDTTPTIFGAAEANSVVRLFIDSNNNNVFDANDLQIGQTVATPFDGTNAFPNGQWSIRSAINFNDLSRLPGYGLDGRRRVFATAEDLAGNVSNAQAFDIF